MSFNDYSDYGFQFNRLDFHLPNTDSQKKYYDRWMQKYSNLFKYDNYLSMEWDLRCRKCLREIFSSATFFLEAQKNLENRCFSSYYFCLYYSLFHAIYSAVFLDSECSIEKLLHVTHKNIIKLFISAFANTKNDILSHNIEATFSKLKYRREYYSYVTPFNNLFDYQKDLEELQEILLDCYQLSAFQSLMVEESHRKNIGKIKKIEKQEVPDTIKFL